MCTFSSLTNTHRKAHKHTLISIVNPPVGKEINAIKSNKEKGDVHSTPPFLIFSVPFSFPPIPPLHTYHLPLLNPSPACSISFSPFIITPHSYFLLSPSLPSPLLLPQRPRGMLMQGFLYPVKTSPLSITPSSIPKPLLLFSLIPLHFCLSSPYSPLSLFLFSSAAILPSLSKAIDPFQLFDL